MGPAAALLALGLAAAVQGRAEVDEQERIERLDAYVRAGMEAWSITGLALAVVRDGRVVLARGYGVREVGTDQAVDEHTLFQIGSCTKPLTATAAALLVSDGVIGWDDPVRRHWPEFRLSDPVATRDATLRDLLAHRTGIGLGEGILSYGMDTTRAEVLGRMHEIGPARPFRTGFRYSNLMYTAAGRLMAEVSGKGWDELLRERLFEPLGMHRTRTRVDQLESMDNVARPHLRVGGETIAIPFSRRDNVGPSASVATSARDLARWLLFVLDDGVVAGRRLVKSEVLRELYRAQVLVDHADPVHGPFLFHTYGLGCDVNDYHGRRLVRHAGMTDGSLAVVGFVPEDGVGVAVLTNMRRNLFYASLFRYAISLFLGIPPEDIDPENRRLIAEHVAHLEAERAAVRARRRLDTRPSLPLAGYAGRYRRELGFEARLDLADDRLVLRYGRFVADLEPRQDETFLGTLREIRLEGEGEWFVDFELADDGEVASMRVHSGHDIDARFERLGD